MQMGLPATILGRPAPSSLEMILMGTGLWVGEFLVSAKEGSTPGLADLARKGWGAGNMYVLLPVWHFPCDLI